MPKKLTKELFIKQLTNEHPELELISEYDGNKNYITVKCKKHNHVFKTKPNWLHKGCGCVECYNEVRGNKTRKNKKQFIEESYKIHGNKYDYSKVEYINNKTKVCIICPEHGEFWQSPNKHLQKHGCPFCAGKYITNDDFIKKANKIHNNKYDYSKVNYVNNSTKVCIICPEHGEFWQTPDKHLQGEGCPICNNSKLENCIHEILSKNNIKFIYNKHFEWLGKQHIDIFLPDYNIAIECQGRQHFDSISFFDKKKKLEERIRLDIRKYELCNDNDVKMFYVINENEKTKISKKKFLGIYSKNTFIMENIKNDNTILLNKIKRDS